MALNIFEPLKFSTQGINDLATQETLVITNGKITVDIVEPKRSLTFAGGNFTDVNSKGIKWTDGRKSKTLAYKDSTLWTDLSVNLAEELSYQINDTLVLSFTELGSTVTKSNLKTVGILKSLIVAGTAEFGGFAYAVSDLNRFGINTDSPAAALGINENGVGIVIGSTKASTAVIGTNTNDNLEIVTDNTARITISNSGEVRAHGKIYADEVITHRSSPVVFKASDTDSIYGKGIVWSAPFQPNKQFSYYADPDRIWSTEIIDLAEEKYFSIENKMVLSKTMLGSTVVESSLKKLGVLTELQVAGDAAVTRTLSTSKIEIGKFSVNENNLTVTDEFNVIRGSTSELKLGADIIIGTSDNNNRTVSVYGKLAVGVANPKEDVSLTVAGSVSFDNKKFTTGDSKPTLGNYNKGDIVWNTDPKATDYIGWVCVTAGSPGAWLPFGSIARQ